VPCDSHYNEDGDLCPVLYDNYYNMPWECDADNCGQVNREHADWAKWKTWPYFTLLEGRV